MAPGSLELCDPLGVSYFKNPPDELQSKLLKEGLRKGIYRGVLIIGVYEGGY